MPALSEGYSYGRKACITTSGHLHAQRPEAFQVAVRHLSSFLKVKSGRVAEAESAWKHAGVSFRVKMVGLDNPKHRIPCCFCTAPRKASLNLAPEQSVDSWPLNQQKQDPRLLHRDVLFCFGQRTLYVVSWTLWDLKFSAVKLVLFLQSRYRILK